MAIGLATFPGSALASWLVTRLHARLHVLFMDALILFGGSMIVHPTAVKLAQARASEEYIWAELDPDPLRKVVPCGSSEQWFDHVEDRNLGSYEGILHEGRCAFEPARRIPYGR